MQNLNLEMNRLHFYFKFNLIRKTLKVFIQFKQVTLRDQHKKIERLEKSEKTTNDTGPDNHKICDNHKILKILTKREKEQARF